MVEIEQEDMTKYPSVFQSADRGTYVIFPKGVEEFCEKTGATALFVDAEEGSILIATAEHGDWMEYPLGGVGLKVVK